MLASINFTPLLLAFILPCLMELTIWQLLLLASAGLVAGFVNVMAGGGSLLTMPVMIFMGFDGSVANGTNRIALIFQCVTSSATFARKGYSDFKLSITLSLCAIPGAVIGAFFGTKLTGVWFNRTLACVMVMVLILMFLKKNNNSDSGRAITKKHLIVGHLFMFIAGLYGGFIQAGVGFILMTILHGIMGIDLIRTNMHKVFVAAVYNGVAVVIFALNGKVFLPAAIALAVGNSAGAYISTHLAIKKGQGVIKIIFTIAIIAIAIKLLLT